MGDQHALSLMQTDPVAQVVECPVSTSGEGGCGRAIPKVLNTVPVANLLAAQHYKASQSFYMDIFTAL